MSHVRYSEQFKREAVRLVTQEGLSLKAAAESVGVRHTTLKTWLLRYGEQSPQRTVFASQQEELEHLRVENRRLRMQRDILKKAAAYFAQQEMTS